VNNISCEIFKSWSSFSCGQNR